MKTKKGLLIIIADDDDGHAELIIDTLGQSGVTDEIIRFANGDKTWQFLQSLASNNIENDSFKVLLLLDIKMPGLNGKELLTRIRSHKTLKSIPVIMLTTTDDPMEMEECYRIGCNIYITKPIYFDLLSDKLNPIGVFIKSMKI